MDYSNGSFFAIVSQKLEYSYLPMYILEDIFLQYKSNYQIDAQIDFLVFTKKICFVVECKNWNENEIKVDYKGQFSKK